LRFQDLFKKPRSPEPLPVEGGILHRKYERFKGILASNNTALSIIADLAHMVYQERPFSLAHVLKQSRLLIREVFSMVEDLNALTGTRYEDLFDIAEAISEAILSELRKKKRIEESALVLPLERLSLEDVEEVGGKAANLGEIYNRARLPVPPGFAVTAYACHHFLEENHLVEKIEEKLGDLDVNDTEKLTTFALVDAGVVTCSTVLTVAAERLTAPELTE